MHVCGISMKRSWKGRRSEDPFVGRSILESCAGIRLPTDGIVQCALLTRRWVGPPRTTDGVDPKSRPSMGND